MLAQVALQNSKVKETDDDDDHDDDGYGDGVDGEAGEEQGQQGLLKWPNKLKLRHAKTSAGQQVSSKASSQTTLSALGTVKEKYSLY